VAKRGQVGAQSVKHQRGKKAYVTKPKEKLGGQQYTRKKERLEKDPPGSLQRLRQGKGEKKNLVKKKKKQT